MRQFLAVLLTGLTVACTAPRPDPSIAQRYSGEAEPDLALTTAVLTATHAYWAEISDGRWREAYEFFTLDYQEDMPFERWRRERHDAWASAPRPVAIHWTKGTHRFQGPELYAILSWTARKASTGSEGTLVWRQQPDGSFLLENSETRVLIRPRS